MYIFLCAIGGLVLLFSFSFEAKERILYANLYERFFLLVQIYYVLYTVSPLELYTQGVWMMLYSVFARVGDIFSGV